MSHDEFPECKTIRALQDRFFLSRLPLEQKGGYWYRERGLNVEPGSVVLFQYQSFIVASAVFVRKVQFNEPEDGYSGVLYFDPQSIRVFIPIDEAIIRGIWPECGSFGRVRYNLTPANYPEFVRLQAALKPPGHAQEILAAAVVVTAPDGLKVFSRADLRRAAKIPTKLWAASYSPIFQGMRSDQPGGAPKVAAEHKNVFRQISRGEHQLTDYGRMMLFHGEASDGASTGEVEMSVTDLENEGYFDPATLSDERIRQIRAVVQRRGQPAFRKKLLAAYGCCVVTGCDAKDALEAAHIEPYMGSYSNRIANGLLLRSDIHTLFDLGLLAISPVTLKIAIASVLRKTSYEKLHGKDIVFGNSRGSGPSRDALRIRWIQFNLKNRG